MKKAVLILSLALGLGCGYYNPLQSRDDGKQMDLKQAEEITDKILGEFCKYYTRHGTRINCTTAYCATSLYPFYVEQENCKDKSLTAFCLEEKKLYYTCNENTETEDRFDLLSFQEISVPVDFMQYKKGYVYAYGKNRKNLALFRLKSPEEGKSLADALETMRRAYQEYGGEASIP